MSKAPSSSQLAKRLPFDPRRAAVDTMRGFDWQRWLTVKAWLGLEEHEALWIEWGEDFTVADTDGVHTYQAKDTSAPLSLGQASAREMIERALEQPRETTTLIWTRSKPGVERRSPSGVAGIELWSRALEGGELGTLRALLKKLSWKSSVVRRAVSGTDEELRAMLKRVRWLTDEKPIEQVRRDVAVAIEKRLEALLIPGSSRRRDTFARLLFGAVTETSVLPDEKDRRLTRHGLDQVLQDLNAEQFSALLPTMQVAGAIPAGLGSYLDDRTPSDASPSPFSLEWFVYNERSIAMIGRGDELASLLSFCSTDANFLWWGIQGEAGLGKSRLAFELLGALASEWHAGFVQAETIRSAVASALQNSRPSLLIVDYPASHSKDVAAAVRAASLAGSENKLRLLLLERDLSPGSDLMRRLLDPLSSASRRVSASKYADPIPLSSLLGQQETILRAWLDAAGANNVVLADSGAQPLAEMLALGDGRPLIIGFIAAALAAGEPERLAERSLASLLEPLVDQELARWSDRYTGRITTGELLTIASVATLTRGILLPGLRPDEFALIIAQGEAGQHVLTVIEAGKKRLPTMEEAIEMDPSGQLEQSIKERLRSSEAALAHVIDSKVQADAIAALEVFAGPNLLVQPDLVAEYIIACRWRDLPSRPTAPLARASDDCISMELRAALELASAEALFTLDQLRQQPLARDAFLRVARLIPGVLQALPAAETSELRTALAQILFNAVVRLGGAKPTRHQRKQLVACLQELHDANSDDDEVAYRLAKAHQTMIKNSDGEVACRSAMIALSLVGRVGAVAAKRPEDDFAEMVLEMAIEVAGVRNFATAEDRPEIIVGSIEVVLRIGAARTEVRDLASRAYFSLSIAVAAVDAAEPAFPSSETRSRRRQLTRLLESMEAFAPELAAAVNHNSRQDLRKAVVNLTLGFAKLGGLDELARARALFERLPREKLKAPDEGLMRANVLRNMLLATLRVSSGVVTRDALALATEAGGLAGACGHTVVRRLYANMLSLLAQAKLDAESADALTREVLGFLARDWPVSPELETEVQQIVQTLHSVTLLGGFEASASRLLDRLMTTARSGSLLEASQRGAVAILVSTRYTREQTAKVLRSIADRVVLNPHPGPDTTALGDAILSSRVKWGDGILEEIRALVDFSIIEQDGELQLFLSVAGPADQQPILTASWRDVSTVRSGGG